MGRVKGSKNNKKLNTKLSTEERLRILANLVIDRIFEEQKTGRLNKVMKLI